MQNNDKKPNKPSSTKTGRKPYQKPVVISDEVFETLALSCGPFPGPCDGNAQS